MHDPINRLSVIAGRGKVTLTGLLGWVLLSLAPAWSASAQSATDPSCPDPGRVQADFPDQPEQSAALVVARVRCFELNGHEMTPRINAYNAALKAAAVAERARGVTVDGGDLTIEQRHLIYGGGSDGEFDNASHAFKLRVFDKYWPDAAAGLRAEYGGGDLLAFTQMRASAMWLVFAALFLFLPWIVIALRRDEGSIGQLPTAGALSADLPPNLATVHLPRMRYSVGIESGTVLRVGTWSETNIDTTVEGGSVRVAGTPHMVTNPTVVVTNPTVKVKSTSVQVDRLWVLTPEGREIKWVFRGGRLEAREGHRASVVWQSLGGDQWRPILGFNHNTGEFDRIDEPIHRLSGWLPWLATAAVAGGLAFAVAGGGAALTIAVLAALYVGLIKGIYRIRRDRRFFKIYEPAYRRFLADADVAHDLPAVSAG
jgi:hypothetical protein